MSGRHVVVDGMRLHVVVAGRGPAVVLLHGLAASHGIWEHVLPALAGRFTVVAPDLPGHGESEKPDASYTIDFFAGVVRTLGRELGIEPVVVVGNSLGGRIALELAAQHPRWVRAAVAAAPARDYERWLGSAWTAVSRLASPAVMRMALDRGIDRSFYDRACTGRTIRARIMHERLGAGDFAAHARAVVRSIAGALGAQHAVARHIRQPLLVAWGREDRLVPFARSADLLRHAPHARLHVFERCGHIPMLEQPDAFVRVLAEFLDSLGAPAAARAAGGA